MNKAVQHRQLAKNLSTDVLDPLSELKGQLSAKTKALVSLFLSLAPVLVLPFVVPCKRRANGRSRQPAEMVDLSCFLLAIFSLFFTVLDCQKSQSARSVKRSW